MIIVFRTTFLLLDRFSQLALSEYRKDNRNKELSRTILNFVVVTELVGLSQGI